MVSFSSGCCGDDDCLNVYRASLPPLQARGHMEVLVMVERLLLLN